MFSSCGNPNLLDMKSHSLLNEVKNAHKSGTRNNTAYKMRIENPIATNAPRPCLMFFHLFMIPSPLSISARSVLFQQIFHQQRNGRGNAREHQPRRRSVRILRVRRVVRFDDTDKENVAERLQIRSCTAAVEIEQTRLIDKESRDARYEKDRNRGKNQGQGNVNKFLKEIHSFQLTVFDERRVDPRHGARKNQNLRPETRPDTIEYNRIEPCGNIGEQILPDDIRKPVFHEITKHQGDDERRDNLREKQNDAEKSVSGNFFIQEIGEDKVERHGDQQIAQIQFEGIERRPDHGGIVREIVKDVFEIFKPDEIVIRRFRVEFFKRKQNGVDVHADVKYGELQQRIGDQPDEKREFPLALGAHRAFLLFALSLSR